MEFGAEEHVEERVVEAVQEEELAQVRDEAQEPGTVALETDAPVEGEQVARDGHREAPDGQDVDERARRGPRQQPRGVQVAGTGAAT